ncbi:MAG TPA: nucleotidyltransferase domain-containing protein [Actinopolymorphaceae bacterium]
MLEVVRTYLRLVDEAAPALVEGLYVHGSVALGDYRPGRSDIDFLALVSHPLDEFELPGLAGVHDELGRLHPRPRCAGDYVSPCK